MFKIKLNPSVGHKFRNVVNDYIDLSLKHQFYRKKKPTKPVNSWHSICTIMDRIDDLVLYLNQKVLNDGTWERCAFDFFEFIEQAGVLIECIDYAFSIYNVRTPAHNVIFKSKCINSTVNNNKSDWELDDDYFKYIRSLSSVHPNDTSQHAIFQEDEFEVSPYAMWNNGIFRISNNKADLIITTYNNIIDRLIVHKEIFINELFNYIKYKYYSLNSLSKVIINYNKNIINNFRKKFILKPKDFSDYLDYLNNLKIEASERNNEIENQINEIIDIFNMNISNKNNESSFIKYKHAIKYALQAYHRQLQNMDYNCLSFFDKLIEKLLLGSVYLKDGKIDYNYYLSKVIYLNEKHGDKIYALSMYKLLLPFFQQYVEITEDDLRRLNYHELYVISQIALYMHALEYDSIINKLIPDSVDYR